MKRYLASAGRIGVTLVALVLAGLMGHHLWYYYMEEPWTRDARVRASIVEVAPDVSGLVSQVLVGDNATVKKGDPILRIDPKRFEIALAQSEASLAAKKAAMLQAQRDYDRAQQLNEMAVSRQAREQAETTLAQDKAAVAQAESDRDLAALNLERSTLRAPVDGIITNFDLKPGKYVSAGSGVAALVDSSSYYVAGYFEETKLPRIEAGDKVKIQLMGTDHVLTGRVESIAAGIEDRERSDGTSLLANVTPTFTWVRLAQRVPVRIALDPLPAGTRLVAGRSATVEVLPGTAPVTASAADAAQPQVR
ncbi:hypothetical protein GCM10007301_10240 [Azorhizobium oxalatiphilum]|uniref:HlyD family secretion protein n=1 Tax=Azorhizobium oxalatiphilum TaxID=980631 RepID=A0A917BNC3_9HYPH|nr:HlyD family secretion protein [Azorhizobium oxalatiphilum]GGF52704.1 hypothetical protein GCM10007301_10240 [Azorhizobium oxalatiphilum]